jgi:putative transposase
LLFDYKSGTRLGGQVLPWLQRLTSDTTIDKRRAMPRAPTNQWPRRPPRLTRLFDNTRPFYFITFNTYERQSFLACDEVHDTFCMFATKAKKHDVAVGRYVIMPDHIHLFAAFPAHGITLPTWVQSLRNVIGKKLVQLGIHKPHWQEGFFDHLLRSQESYSDKWEYVRMNPVRAKLRDAPDTWPYQGEIVRIPFY